MEDFPIDKIKFMLAHMEGEDGDVTIKVDIEPFTLTLDEYSEEVSTCLYLEHVNIPLNINELENRRFKFPVNPEEGYIDGSIYFFAAHSPVDVKEIQFGKNEGGMLPMVLDTTWVLEYEKTGFKNFNSVVNTSVLL